MPTRRQAILQGCGAYIVVPRSVANMPGLTEADKLVFGYLLDALGDNDHCWPRVETIAEAMSISTRSVSRSIARLEEVRMISVQRDRKADKLVNVYAINAPEEWDAAELEGGRPRPQQDKKSGREEKSCEDNSSNRADEKSKPKDKKASRTQPQEPPQEPPKSLFADDVKTSIGDGDGRKGKRESRHDALTRAVAPYRQFTDHFNARKVAENASWQFIPKDGAILAQVWQRVGGNLLLARGAIDAYFADGSPSVEGHPSPAFLAGIEKYMNRAQNGASSTKHGYPNKFAPRTGYGGRPSDLPPAVAQHA